MKKCPHCKRELSFGVFVTRYGSDTLLSHPSNAHLREHICKHCRHKIWVHYSHFYFHRLMRDYFLTASAASAAVSLVCWNAGLFTDPRHAFGLMVILVLMAAPIAVFHAKYRSLVLNEENTPVPADTFTAGVPSK